MLVMSSPAGVPTDNADGQTENQFPNQPYFQRIQQLQHAFPPLPSFLKKIKNEDYGRKLVRDYYRKSVRREIPGSAPQELPQGNPANTPGGVPGRCYCLIFEVEKVAVLDKYPKGFDSPADLAKYLTEHPAKSSREKLLRRLFILEDLEPGYVDVLGHHLGVDPLVFSEQMNTWNFTDSSSIPYRVLPSVCTPKQSFTLRYYETRTLDQKMRINPLTLQMTFAVNRRRYECWRDLDLPKSDMKDKRHAFIRRCASFWTSQSFDHKDQGWDALLLVDPGMACVNVPPIPNKDTSNTTYILRDPKQYHERAGLWNAPPWSNEQSVQRKEHKSLPYHGGCQSLTQLLFPLISGDDAESQMVNLKVERDLASPLDEQVFYWTKVASKGLIESTNENSSNTAYYLLKHIAQHWMNHLELINSTVARGEYLSDDYQATINDNLSQKQWKADLIQVHKITKDINYLRRHMNHFRRAMILNLVRLDIQLGCEQVDPNLPLALRDAQKDLLTIHGRLKVLHQRAESLTVTSNDLANLRATFRGVHDGEFSLRLSLFASIVFPLTLLAGIFSMNEEYLPGTKAFLKICAFSLPFVAAFALVLVYGSRPFLGLHHDLKEYGAVFRRRREERSGGTKDIDDFEQRDVWKKKERWHASLCWNNGSV